jgi:hypothetical protein
VYKREIKSWSKPILAGIETMKILRYNFSQFLHYLRREKGWHFERVYEK